MCFCYSVYYQTHFFIEAMKGNSSFKNSFGVLKKNLFFDFGLYIEIIFSIA